jgi:hypothetical protein
VAVIHRPSCRSSTQTDAFSRGESGPNDAGASTVMRAWSSWMISPWVHTTTAPGSSVATSTTSDAAADEASGTREAEVSTGMPTASPSGVTDCRQRWNGLEMIRCGANVVSSFARAPASARPCALRGRWESSPRQFRLASAWP